MMNQKEDNNTLDMIDTHYIQNYVLTHAYGKRNQNRICAVLYDYGTDSHLYLFNVNKEEGFCTMMCEPIDKDFAYCELSVPLLEDIDYYYGHYEIIKNDPNIGRNYNDLRKELKEKENRLLSSRS